MKLLIKDIIRIPNCKNFQALAAGGNPAAVRAAGGNATHGAWRGGAAAAAVALVAGTCT